MPRISIVVVSYNTSDCLAECLDAIGRYAAADVEIIVVDNASVDGSADRVRRDFPEVRLVASPTNVGFGPANNLGVAVATAPWLMLLNSDAILRCDTPGRLVDYLAAHPAVACAGPRVVLPDATLQPRTWGHVPTARRVLMQSLGLNRALPRTPFFDGIDGIDGGRGDREVGWISGVCMSMRTADYVAVGGFDARFFMYCEDIDLCLKLAARGRVVRVDAHDVMHYGGVSSKSVAAKVRNAVWQQRHLLTILRERDGATAALLSHLFVAAGLLGRLALGATRIPSRGFRDNEALRSAWSRLVDALRFGAPLGG